LSKSLFYSASPVGESIFCGPSAFTVAGIVESGGESIETAWTGEEGGERIDQNDFLVPYTTTLRLEPDIRISQLNIYVSKSYTGSVVAEMKSALNFHLKKPENYIIQDPKEILAAIEKESRVFTIFLGCIASISLLVGGIGIMNVMLTSVAERTREIGVRKAVGASQKAILVQFMIESCVICVIGGSIGIILGSVISYLLPFLSSHKIASSILGSSLIVSFFFAFLVGLIFGTLPAVRASRLSPAEALRFE
jgi:putative ABC transport system permease protein